MINQLRSSEACVILYTVRRRGEVRLHDCSRLVFFHHNVDFVVVFSYFMSLFLLRKKENVIEV